MKSPRIIRPEFPTSQSMGRVSREARLLFIQMWLVAEDDGSLQASNKVLANLLYPYDEDAIIFIGDWRSELEAEGCIDEKEGRIQICNWGRHQKNMPQRKRAEVEPRYTLDVTDVFGYWRHELGHRQAKLGDRSSKRFRAIAARIKEGYTVEQIKRAIDGIKKSAYHMGDNNNGMVYDDIELICRDAKHVDMFMRLANTNVIQMSQAGRKTHGNLMDWANAG